MHLVGLHFAHEVIDHFRLGDENGLAHEVGHGEGLRVPAQPAAQDVLEVDDSVQIVRGFADYGNP